MSKNESAHILNKVCCFFQYLGYVFSSNLVMGYYG